MLMVSEHTTGFGVLPLMLVSMGLPALGRSRRRDMSDALRSWFDRSRPSGANWCKAPQPSFAGTTRARNCIRNTPSRVEAKKTEAHHAFYLVHRTRHAAAGFRTGSQGQWSYEPVACTGRCCAG